ncbi:MarR family transcriptional regulator [Nocardia asteroides NBRC 15531]|uniref:MarR family transcriptional regulator n=1 Tax=Nocardia asteroides NBRC 15531 TaxID=1110697 RepID=U5EBR6_NOCAS|nr:MarR family transcriptional regulator [Nocardia asteroides]TLF69773.1 MarR family transcriptional regulator [Nocardia asteroides NBRC 15531]UGT49278.1 MarR family transcriptional regulator [Nocardia asteroides]SFL85671.1 DNA-binding transcriptional regulator, MarR family [Nocardia asteroides]VEG38353.1 transcriptional repressor MprA [Nocardia asteroides]GAD83861.1 putative MarR family transcriptional regulator [Nocardia asteroides NBRC 15531]
MQELFDDPRLTISGLLFEAHSGVLKKVEPVWKAHGLSGLDLNALMRLSRSPRRRLRMSDLAAQTDLSTSGVTRLVDRLAAAGLVERRLDPTDRRSAYAALTDAGATRLEQVLPDYLVALEEWLTGLLTPAQLDGLVTGLRVIRDATNPTATAIADRP